MSEPKHKVGDVLPNGVVITQDLLDAIVKFEAFTPEQIDDPHIAAELRRRAEEHAEILRRSRECSCYLGEDGRLHMRDHCPMHTVYR